MRVILQRVSSASVQVEGIIKGEIGEGLVALVGFGTSDDVTVLEPMARKILNIRIFSNDEGRFHSSLLDKYGEILAVPQFTLYAKTSKGRRPDFFGALAPNDAADLFDRFVSVLESAIPSRVQQGVFGAMMSVSLTNEGPVTIILDSAELQA